MTTNDNTLDARERYILTNLASSAELATAQQAQALLKWARGESVAQIAQTLDMDGLVVQHWLDDFAQKRLERFAPSAIEGAARGVAGLTTINALLKQQQVSPAHPRYVATLALQLFDHTASVHQLPRACRTLLATAALLHTIGLNEDAKNYQRAGRDLILAHEFENIAARERDMLACLVHFHRKKAKPAQDLIFASFDRETQDITLRLAAILRVADGLDDGQSQSTRVQAVHMNEVVDVVVEGPSAAGDAARANKQADLWQQVMTIPLQVRLPHEPPAQVDVSIAEPEAKPTADEPISKAGRRIIKKQFEKFLACQEAVRADRDEEAVHDMRVAARRMRSAFRLLRPYARKALKGLRKPLRDVAQQLGAVRDLDVLIKNARAYAEPLPPERQSAFERLIADWYERRQEAQRDVVSSLDAKRYRAWQARMNDFLRAKADETGPRLCDEAPPLIWQQYAEVRRYESRVGDASLATLHELRIQCKRLRYTLEFFSDVLGDSTPRLIEALVAVQDQLGELHDADVARQRVVAFIADQTTRPDTPLDASALQEATAYLGALQNRTAALRASFPERWQAIVAPSFRQALAEAVAAL